MRDYKKVLLDKTRKIVQKYVKVACEQVAQQYQIEDTVDGDAKIYASELEIAQDTISQSVIAYGQKAWILEFGKGSLMETSGEENPFLEDYLNSELFNKARLSNAYAITGRPRGDYLDIDGNVHHSHGNLYGVNLEEWIDKKTGNQAAVAYAPRRVIYRILYGSGQNGLLSMMADEIQDAMMGTIAELLQRKWKKEIRLL